MRKYFYFIIILIFIACKNNENQANIQKNISPQTDTISKNTEKTYVFPPKKIDSISSFKKELNARYLYCGKSNLHTSLFEILKHKNPKEYNQLKSITTAHCVIINQDTLYISGKEEIKCYTENDSVNLKCTVYQLYHENFCTDLLIIDKIIKY